MNRLLAVAALTAGGLLLRNQMRKRSGRFTGGSAGMSTTTQSIEIDVPVSTAFNQWTQFEEFPRFMQGVKEIQQLDDTHLHWRAEIAGKEEQWDAEITHQIPDRRIAWRSVTGARNEGCVTFEPLSDSRTRIDLRIDYEPQDMLETLGDAVGAVDMRVRGDLQRFKSFIEGRGQETGAWRGTVGAAQTSASY
jgi:uncharacterized membrane protein